MKRYAVLLTLFLGTLFSAEAWKCDAPFYAKLFKIPNLMQIAEVQKVIQIDNRCDRRYEQRRTKVL